MQKIDSNHILIGDILLYYKSGKKYSTYTQYSKFSRFRSTNLFIEYRMDITEDVYNKLNSFKNKEFNIIGNDTSGQYKHILSCVIKGLLGMSSVKGIITTKLTIQYNSIEALSTETQQLIRDFKISLLTDLDD